METKSLSRHASVRRTLLLAASSSAAVAVAPGRAQTTTGSSGVLIAYLSRSGNTRVVAGQIARANAADVFEIQTVQPYPEDYRQMVEQAQRETEAGAKPLLRAAVVDIARYQTIFLGFPIWGMTAPSPIRSFLAQHDLTGKTLVPFITHGGYGTGRSLSVIAELAPGARIGDAFVMQADQERDTLERVTRWLGRNQMVR